MRLAAARLLAVVAVGAGYAASTLSGAQRSSAAHHGRTSLLLRGTVVTMDSAHRVIANGRVLIRGGVIAAVWSGARVPSGISLRGVRVVDAGPRGLIFPGLIDIHDHPAEDFEPVFAPPSSDRQPQFGRPTGHEPYDYRYEWNTAPESPQYRRLVVNPQVIGTDLGLEPQIIVHDEARAALAGEVAVQGEPEVTSVPGANGLLVRDIDGENFGTDRIASRVASVEAPGFASTDARVLRTQMADGSIDAWVVHLAEGVRDSDREPGDSYSSRREFATIQALGLLNDATVVVHGTALEPADFATMRGAGAAGPHAPDDGLGAKLAWSPLSNLLLYGHTTNVYDALAAGVTVSLSTDWTPSGSNTLLDELKVADIALRDRRILGRSRVRVPALRSDVLLDRTLVDMVTRNPASALRWPSGSIEPGKAADLLVLRRPADTPTGGMPDSPYRSLIDATERDVRLVLIGGAPVAGDVGVMRKLLGRALQIVRSRTGRYGKALAYSRSGRLPQRALRLGSAERTLAQALAALGGDGARPASGPPPPSAKFTYLQRRWDGGQDRSMAPAAFRNHVLAPVFGRLGRRLNIERISLGPLFSDDDGIYFDFLGAAHSRAGVPKDRTPPYRLYPANFNQIGPGGDPFSRRAFFDRWYARR